MYRCCASAGLITPASTYFMLSVNCCPVGITRSSTSSPGWSRGAYSAGKKSTMAFSLLREVWVDVFIETTPGPVRKRGTFPCHARNPIRKRRANRRQVRIVKYGKRKRGRISFSCRFIKAVEAYMKRQEKDI